MRMLYLLLTSLLAATACHGGPTLDQPRSLAAPAHSGKRLFDQLLAPSALTRDPSRLSNRAKSMLTTELDLGSADERLGWMLQSAHGRLAGLEQSGRRLASAEFDRLRDLPRSAVFDLASPQSMGRRLRSGLRTLPTVLGLDRQPLAEPDDLRHRTDPDDDHPQASFIARIWRRVLP